MDYDFWMEENFIAIKCTCTFKITFYTKVSVGSVTCPVNNVNLDSLSLIRNKKGRSQVKGMGKDADKGTNWAIVVAAASVPSSFTSMKAFWRTE